MAEKESTLQEELDELIKQMEIAKKHGFGGHNLAQRIDGDLRRIINSAWLNLADYSYSSEKNGG